MRTLRRLARLLRNVLRRSRVERDLDAEVRGMFELLVDQKIAEGLAPRAARRGTALELGTVESMKTEVRDARTGGWLDVLRQDVRDAWRGLSAGKGTTALAFSILAFAIAAGTVTFSVVDAVALRPLPYGNPENLVGIAWLTPKYAEPMPAMGRDYVAWRDAVPALESIAAAGGFPAPVQVQLNGTTVALTEGRVTAALFEVLGVRPALGRLFRADDEQPGRSAVAVLPHESWMRHFGGDPAAIGRVLTMGDARREIVGVLPVGVMFPVGDQATDIFVIETETPTSPYLPVEVVARLRPGATIAQVSG